MADESALKVVELSAGSVNSLAETRPSDCAMGRCQSWMTRLHLSRSCRVKPAAEALYVPRTYKTHVELQTGNFPRSPALYNSTSAGITAHPETIIRAA